MIPLCCLVTNEAMRTSTHEMTSLIASFDSNGYVRSSAPFLVSTSRPREGFLVVTDMDLQEWGPIWRQVNEEFEWGDLRGIHFLFWDGNHRLKAWLARIYEGVYFKIKIGLLYTVATLKH